MIADMNGILRLQCQHKKIISIVVVLVQGISTLGEVEFAFAIASEKEEIFK